MALSVDKGHIFKADLILFIWSIVEIVADRRSFIVLLNVIPDIEAVCVVFWRITKFSVPIWFHL